MDREPDLLVGIDLGTTYSCIAYVDDRGIPVTIPNRDDEPITASAIRFQENNRLIVGRQAIDYECNDPQAVATLVKRSMGEPIYDEGRLLRGRVHRPEALSAVILRKLKQDAERRMRRPVTKAVITVPAFFDDARRYATRLAGEIAGFEVLDIINEPTAAALAYALGGSVKTQPAKLPKMTALVYDLGGGTFDVSIVRLEPGQFRVMASNGDVKLGGRDWDAAIMDWMCEQFIDLHDIDPRSHPDVRADLRNRIEQAKQSFFSDPEGAASITVWCEGEKLTATFNLARFNELTAGLMLRTRLTVEHVIEQARLTWKDVDRVLLVGGSTRMPSVRAMLAQVTGREPESCPGIQEIVAHGAALYAAMFAIQSDDEDLVVAQEVEDKLGKIEKIDVNPHSIGVRALRNERAINDKLIVQNTALPAVASRVYRTANDRQKSIKVRILEGEAPEADAATLLGECRIEQISQNLPKGSPIQVRISCEQNGIVDILALDMTTGNMADTRIERRSEIGDHLVDKERSWLDSQTVI